MTDHPGRSDGDDRDLLVRAYVDGDADAAARARIEADPELRDEARAHERLRAELRRPLPVDAGRRERALAAALAAFDEGDAPTADVAPPPVSLAERRRRRWLIPAAAALAVVAAGTVVANLGGSDSEQVADTNTARDELAITATEATTHAGATETLAVFDAAEGGADEAGDIGAVEDAEDGALPAPDAAEETTSDLSSAAAAAQPALPRVSSGAELAELAAAMLVERAAGTTDASLEPTLATARSCADDIIAVAELAVDDTVRAVVVRVDTATTAAGEAVALDAETCDEVLRAPMP